MIFLIITLVSIILYVKNKKSLSLLIYAFFISDGFQLVPESLFILGDFITKSRDYALIQLFITILYELNKNSRFFIIDNISKQILLFISFVSLVGFLSFIYYEIPTNEILRTGRYFFLWLIFFVLGRCTLEDLYGLIKWLLAITVICSILYLVQIAISTPILNGYAGEKVFNDNGIIRYYNIPYFLYFFVFYQVFSRLNKYRYPILILFICVIIFSLFRSLVVATLLLIVFGLYLKGKKLNYLIPYIIGISVLILPFKGLIMERFEKGGTAEDIQLLLNKGFKDYTPTPDATLTFRVAHVYERTNKVLQDPVSALFGVGFVTEDSPNISKLFNFKVGLINPNTNDIIQVDTADILYSLLILRLGFIGCFLFLILHISFIKYFLKRRNHDICLSSLLCILFFILTSFANIKLIHPWAMFLPMIAYWIDKKTMYYQTQF